MMKSETEMTAGTDEISADPIRCPICRENMIEFDRILENGFWFVWYHCSGDSCSGQWLEKKPMLRQTA